MRRFELVLPGSLDDCVKALARHGSEAKLLAGGTDLLPQMKNGLLKPAVVIDLSGVPGCAPSSRPTGRDFGSAPR